MRTVIVHLHLLKNAGTSVESILERNFGDRWLSYDLEAASGNIFASELAALIEAQPQVVAISSHQIRRPLPDVAGVELVPLTFLRHPLDRIQSAYDFDRRRGPVTRNAELVAELDFAAYVRMMLDGDDVAVRDFQVRMLADGWHRETGRPCAGSRHDFESARDFIRSLPAVGVVDRWTASWARLSDALTSRFPGFAAEASHENRAADAPGSLADRLELMQTRLGTALYAELGERNALDFELYEEARSSLG